MTDSLHIAFDNSYQQLGDQFFTRNRPTPVAEPGLIRVNDELARQLHIDPQQLRSTTGIACLAGNEIPEGAAPIATAYAGHQFGNWNPQLGDGRAILLGEVIGNDGKRYDIQLKGAGTTRYSRMGDGRSPLGPVLREYIVSEFMAAMGVPTTRALAAVTTGETVAREELLPGAILTRVARSHIRVGTFQYFALQEDHDSVQQLADHVIERHYPQAAQTDNPYLQLLIEAVAAQAKLIAHWQSLGFIHGVMNTDNMLVGGETVDYGPCAFMEAYRSDTVFSSIDRGGRYAYSNQPSIAHWNLAWLAQSLLRLIDDNEKQSIQKVTDVLDTFPTQYQQYYRTRMSQKLGFSETSDLSDACWQEYLSLMTEQGTDFTLGFRVLSSYLSDDKAPQEPTSSADNTTTIEDLYALPESFHDWIRSWKDALNTQETLSLTGIAKRMDAINPVLIPRNHHIEAAIQAANQGDFSGFHRLMDALQNPFEFNTAYADMVLPAKPTEAVRQTFCGT